MKQSKSIFTLLLSLWLVLALAISAPGKDKDTIAFVQHALNCLGYPSGTVNGTYNAKTKSAIKKYQKASQLNVNGKVTQKLEASLNDALEASLEASKLKVHVLDMGEGQAILLESNGEYVLYDGGPVSGTSKLITYLSSEKLEGIKYLICSHIDEDHLGGALTALYVYDVKKVFAPLYAPESSLASSLATALERKGLTAKAPKVGKTYSFGKAEFTILSPGEEEYENIGDSSIAIQVQCKGNTLLLTGDAGKVSEKEMIKTFGKDLSSDLLILSSSGGSKAFLNKVKPGTVILTYDKSEEPSKTLKKLLKEKEVELYRTDKQGDLVFWTGKKGWASLTPPYKDYSIEKSEDSASITATPSPDPSITSAPQAPQVSEAASPDSGQTPGPTPIPDHLPGDYSWALGPDYGILAYDEGIGHTYYNAAGRTYNPILGELGWFQGYNANGYAIIRPESHVTPEEDIPPVAESVHSGENNDSENSTKSYTYVVNKATKVFHYSACPATGEIDTEYKRKIFGTRQELISQGFTPCDQCNP